MKSLLKGLVLVAAAAVHLAPLASFAQSNTPVSRADVHADLAHVEQAGYNPNDWAHYPENVQNAETRAAAQNQGGAYGADPVGSSQSGQRGEVTVSPYSPPVEVVGH